MLIVNNLRSSGMLINKAWCFSRQQMDNRKKNRDSYIKIDMYIKWQKMQNSQVSVNETVIIFYKNTLNTILKYIVQFCCR